MIFWFQLGSDNSGAFTHGLKILVGSYIRNIKFSRRLVKNQSQKFQILRVELTK
jgi:hypothetical protein